MLVLTYRFRFSFFFSEAALSCIAFLPAVKMTDILTVFRATSTEVRRSNSSSRMSLND